MYAVYSVALRVFLAGYLPLFVIRRLRRPNYAENLRQRFGHVGDDLPPEPRAWVHAVSVGEVAAAAPLVEAIRRRWPQFSIVLSTVTPTGARVVKSELGRAVTHRYFPLDLPRPVARALDAVQPRFFIGLETELWPNFLGALASRGVPTLIANGRISDRSFKRYRLVRPFVARMLARVSMFGMQSDEDARRIIALGAPAERVVVTGNLKADQRQETPEARPDWVDTLGLGADSMLWVAGSTHRGEEAMVLEAFEQVRSRVPELRLLLAPRHPERADEVERLVRERGLSARRRTTLGVRRLGPTDVMVLDTVGELSSLYRYATVVFVGGSLVPSGGHNMLEPAQRKRPILFGPHTENFRESAELLLDAGGALVVKDAVGLRREVERVLEDPDLGRRMGEAAFAAVVTRQGALDRTLALVERYLIAGAGSRA